MPALFNLCIIEVRSVFDFRLLQSCLQDHWLNCLISCRSSKALVSLHVCEDWSLPQLLAYTLGTTFAWNGSFKRQQTSAVSRMKIFIKSTLVSTCENVPSDICTRRRLRSACTAAPSNHSFRSTVCLKKCWILSYPQSAHWRLWSACAFAQADQSLRWALI